MKGIRSTNPVAVGDYVNIILNQEGTAFISEIEDRKNYIIRRASNLSKQSHILAAGKPMILVFNKIDAYTYIEKAADDLTPRTKENLTLEELMKTWMAKMEDNCLFISAREKINMEELKSVVYQRVKELHVQKYPYNDFLYQTYEEEV